MKVNPLVLGRRKKKNGVTGRKKKKTKFDEYLEMEMKGGDISAEEDLRLERKLAKKLKVKGGKLQGADDEFNTLLEGIPSVLDSLSEEAEEQLLGNEEEEEEEEEDVVGGGVLDGREELSEQCEEEQDILNMFEKGKSIKKRKMNERVDNDISGEVTDDSVDEECNMSNGSCEEHLRVQKKAGKAKKKTKFEEYLETEIRAGDIMAEHDLALESKLAKKLKVNQGKLPGHDDGLNMLFEGIPSFLKGEGTENACQPPIEGNDEGSTCKNHKKIKLAEQGQDNVRKTLDDAVAISDSVNDYAAEVVAKNGKKVAPAAGTGVARYVAPHMRSLGVSESQEHAQIRRRLRGLLNRLSESNVESITNEISTIFHSLGRAVGCPIISEEVLASCSGGPRGNEQYAAVFAAFVAGLACLVGIDFGAKILASLAICFEEEYQKEDNLSLRNLTLLLSYLYIFGVCSSDLIYDFLIMLGKRLMEVDVSTILTVLQSCGMKLRGDDPIGMKSFILSVQDRVKELKASSGSSQTNMTSKRMEFMLETICDIKNNKKRAKEDTVQHTRIKKWLQKLRIENIIIRGLNWTKLLDPNKKGQWWLSGDIASTVDNIEEVASTIDREVQEAQKMLHLAAAQRMNTDTRRAIFCIIMSGEDYIDAFEKLLRLDLPGKQDREIIRVLLECCLQEKVFNKYYCVLASKLCSHDKNHKFTLQYCLWDHFKELESMQLSRSMHLAKFVAEMLASFSLSLAALKVIDLSDTIQLTPKKIMHFRMMFETIFEFPDRIIWNIFTRIAVTPEYESLRNGIEFFINKYVKTHQKSLGSRFKLVRKAFHNVEGVLM